MRDEYVGDIGDFGKYILLRELSALGEGSIKTGVNWYYNANPAPAFMYLFDGNSLQLNGKQGALFSRMEALYASRKPNLSDVMNGDILPGCFFYAEPMQYPKSIEARESYREGWFQKSLTAFKSADVIFVDPDNGIAPPTVTKRQLNSSKYAYLDEIEKYYHYDDSGKSVIVYQHLNRTNQEDFVHRFSEELRKIRLTNDPTFLRCPRCTVRYYALIAKTDKHLALFSQLFDKLTKDYSALFEPA